MSLRTATAIVGTPARIGEMGPESTPPNDAGTVIDERMRVLNEEIIMKTNIVLSCVVACAFAGLAPLSVMADPAMEMGSPEAKVVIRDSAITSSIRARLESDQVGGFKHVRVDTDDHGIVTLKGHTRTQEAADRAISITKETEGVREVKSAIEIKIDD